MHNGRGLVKLILMFTWHRKLSGDHPQCPVHHQFHVTLWVDIFGLPLVRYLNTSQLQSSSQAKKMAHNWELVILFAVCCVAMGITQALSQNCMEDTNTFLWEINQEKPTDYAAQSKSWYIFKGLSIFLAVLLQELIQLNSNSVNSIKEMLISAIKKVRFG